MDDQDAMTDQVWIQHPKRRLSKLEEVRQEVCLIKITVREHILENYQRVALYGKCLGKDEWTKDGYMEE